MLEKIVKEKCGNCISYLTDEDENGKIAEFHHDRNKASGFCAMWDLFHWVENNEKACESWIFDGEEE